MSRDLFWLSYEQWNRIEPHLPTDVRGKDRVDTLGHFHRGRFQEAANAASRPFNPILPTVSPIRCWRHPLRSSGGLKKPRLPPGKV